MRTKLTNQQIAEITHLYTEGQSTRRIAALFDVDAETVRLLLHKLGVKSRSREEACTRYTLDKTFFDNIDTEEKAYWLGFLTADGGITNHQLILSLKVADTGHIEAFCASIKSNHPIKTVFSKIKDNLILQPRLTISSMPIVRALLQLGVGERKSLIVKPAACLPRFQAAYWRGYFDGDGHIYLSEKARTIELTGNQFMLAGFAAFIRKAIGISSKITKSKSVYRIRHPKRSSVFAIAKLLYLDSSIHLKRKYEAARTIFEDKSFHLRKNSAQRVKSASGPNLVLPERATLQRRSGQCALR